MTCILDDNVFLKRWVNTRPVEENPFDPRCHLHLQRICGTCEHFQGALRGAPPHGSCAYYDLTKHCRAGAAHCPRWVRKAAPDA